MTKLLEIDGLPVRNAKRPITLTVTSGDIKSANLKQPNNCAVAKACKRDLNVSEVRVHLTRVYLRTGKGDWIRYQTPKDMRSEIIAFDRGGAFEPGKFTLAKIPASKQSRVGEGVVPRSAGKGKKRKRPHVMTNVRAIAA